MAAAKAKIAAGGAERYAREKTEFDEQMCKREAKAERLTHFASKRWRRSLASSNR